ncbi:MAG: 50S ribosomal protein L4 [Armatimonadetes bacterium]|nr:50S ribosomal protein L4 [Armatimonadota bacterium]
MPKIAVVNMNGEQVSEIELSEAVFGIEPNEAVVYEAVRAELANRRQGTHSTKTRGEVSGGGRKPWRQKGTGRARHGSTRSPIWRHGGVVFGPKPRDYSIHLPKKKRHLAMRSALSAKLAEGEIAVVDRLVMEEFSTKQMIRVLANLQSKPKTMLVLDTNDLKVRKSAGNIPGIECTVAPSLSLVDVLKAHRLIVTQEAVARIEEVFAR